MPTANMGITEPTDHGSTDVWGAALNTALDLIDAHDHTSGKGVKVPSAGLKINADVSWSFGGTNYAITDAKAIDFTPTAASGMTAYSSALFANSSDSNNLYFRNSAGTNVKITDGSTLNISIVGGIGGDYTSIGALLDYDDATDTYRFRQETAAAVRQYAKILAADVRLAEYKASGDPTPPTNFVTLKSPAALAASYSVTWPAAVPGSTLAVQMSSAGALSASNAFTGAVSSTGTMSATEFKHSTALGLVLGAASAIDPNGTHTRGLGAGGGQKKWIVAASANVLQWPIELPAGMRITSYNVYLDKQTNGAATVTARIYKVQTQGVSMGTETALGSGNSSNANAPGSIALTESSLSIDIAAGFAYYLVFTPSGAANDTLYSAEIAYTRP